MSRHVNLRVNLFLGVVLLVSSLIVYRLFILSVLRHASYIKASQAQSESINDVLARGNIYFNGKDSSLVLAATNKKFPLAYIIPAEIGEKEKEKVIQQLSSIFSIDPKIIKEKIDPKSKSVKVIARKIKSEQVEAVKGINAKGVGVSYETSRFYPGESIASHVIGFMGHDSEGEKAGQYGVEEYYNQELFGREPDLSRFFAYADNFNFIPIIKGLLRAKTDDKTKKESFDRPVDLVLTVDNNIQIFVENKLKSVVEKWKAESGTIIIQEPKSGKIIAMADWPNFNLNSYADSKPENFLNGSIQEVYEPGSSFKPITMSAGIDLAKITPQTIYEDKGFVNIAGYTIHNFSERVFGVQTMTQVLENSVNTGTMHVENLVGDDNFLNYIINMGFGQKTGIDLPGEVSGDITNLYTGRKINYLTASFGQGIAVTPLQLINAYSVVANGGKLMRPYLVEKIIKDGNSEVLTKPEVVAIPISDKTAVKLQSMLISVVDHGFDKARIQGYDIAGKTGTAQIPDGRGGYLEKEFIHNFVGFAPAYDAKFVILIKMDKPQGIQFAADSLSPVFREIAAFLLNYYNLPPTRK